MEYIDLKTQDPKCSARPNPESRHAMSENLPLFTIGILGSYDVGNLTYKINTYIGQTEPGYELIFSLDKKYCTPVHLINDALLAAGTDIGGKISILEGNGSGIASHAAEVIRHARGTYILLVSIEDFFYDADALGRVKKAIAGDRGQDIYVFRTLLRAEEYLVYGQKGRRFESNSICYPAALLRGLRLGQEDNCKNIIALHKMLFEKLGRKQEAYIYKDENVFVHVAGRIPENKNENALMGLYGDDEWMETELLQEIHSLTGQIQADATKLSAGSVCRLHQMCRKSRESKESKKTIPISMEALKREMCIQYLKSRDGEWGMGEDLMQYLKMLDWLYGQAEGKRSCRIWFWKFSLFRMHRKKLKLVFLAMEYAVWPSLQSVYKAALKDRRFDVRLVYVPFSHVYSKTDHQKEMHRFWEKGYAAIWAEDFDLPGEAPDVAIFVKPYDAVPKKFQIQEVRKVAGLTVYIPYGMETGMDKECLNYQCYGTMHYYADYILAYAPAYYEKCRKYTLRKGANYLCIGHPRIDLKDEREYEDLKLAGQVLQKAGSRKIILWNTHFTIGQEGGWGTFLKFGDYILDYFKNHPNLFLLWRPHPFFYKALSEHKKYTLEEALDEVRSYHSRDNVFLDETDTYLTAFRLSDAMVTDWSSFVPEYIAYQKPFLVTQKQAGGTSMLSQENLDIALENRDISDFLKQVDDGRYDRKAVSERLHAIYLPKKRRTVAGELLDILYRRVCGKDWGRR